MTLSSIVNTFLQASLSDPWFWTTWFFGSLAVVSLGGLANLNSLCNRKEREIANLKAFIDIKVPRPQSCRCGLSKPTVAK